MGFFQFAVFLPLFKKLTIYFMLSCLYKEPATLNYSWCFVGFFLFSFGGGTEVTGKFWICKNYINKSNQGSWNELSVACVVFVFCTTKEVCISDYSVLLLLLLKAFIRILSTLFLEGIDPFRLYSLLFLLDLHKHSLVKLLNKRQWRKQTARWI